MDRRDFLSKSVFAASAGLALDACTPGSDQIIPILIPEEVFVPGEEQWVASTCHGCGAGCGIQVRKIDGRLTKVEGLREHPVSRGGVCARGQALPQAMYHPDRLRTPLARVGDELEPIEWNEAIDRVAEALRDRRSGLCGLTGESTGHTREMMRRFLATHGGDRHLIHAPFPSSEAAGLPFDLDRANYIISFEAELLEAGPSAVGFARSLAEARQSRPGRRGKFVMIGPRLSLTAASADEWIPTRPGQSVELAREIARACLDEGLSPNRTDAESDNPITRSLDGVEPRAEARRLAREMTSHLPAVAVSIGDRTLAQAVRLLNRVLGAPTIRVAPPPFRPWPELANPAPPEHDLVQALASDYVPEVLLVHETNPAYSLPPEAGFEEFMSGAGLRIAITSFLDETAGRCDLVLPESMAFERFADAVPTPILPMSVATLSGPLLSRPLYDTRSMPDMLIGIAERTGNESSFPWSSYEQALRFAWEGLDTPWTDAIANGGFWSAEAAAELPSVPTGVSSAPLAPIGASPAEGSSGLVLHVYPSAAFVDGRSAHLPFLQEMSDPITGVRWGSVIEISTTRAAELGVRNGDRVEVSTGSTSLEAPAFVTPGIHPDVIALAAGQGHSAFTRYATGRGVNGFALTGLRPYQSVPVSVRKIPT